MTQDLLRTAFEYLSILMIALLLAICFSALSGLCAKNVTSLDLFNFTKCTF
jgi:hypothetical protein